MRKTDSIMKRIIKHTKKLLKHPHAKKVTWGSAALTTIITGAVFKTKIFLVVALVAEFFSFGKVLDLHDGKAATANGTLTATATVAAYCTISGNTMAFGAYTGTQTDQTGVVTTNCTKGTNFTVTMATAQTGGFYQMASGANTLNYKVYKETGRTTEIVASTVVLTDNNASGNDQAVTIYGRIPSGQSANIGSYSGTTTFTVTY
jgi:spore coat protein U-like protein